MRSTPKPERLTILEQQRGKPAHEWLPALLSNMTPFNIATALGVYPNAVRYWQKRLKAGYIRRDGEWVKVGAEQEQAS